MDDSTRGLARWVLESAEREAAELPVFPAVAVRLVDLLEQPGAEVGDAQALIAQDQVIAAQVLRTANSALYASAMPVESIAQAVMRLGFRESANIAMTAACRSLFDVEDRAEREIFPRLWSAIWHQSLVCAYGGRLMARELKAGDPEHVFLGALLRSVGRLLVLKTVARGLVRGRLRGHPSEAAMAAVMAALHGRLGQSYLVSCNLPAHVVAIAADLPEADLPGCAPDVASIEIVRLAEGLCDLLAVAPFATGAIGPAAEESADVLGIGPERLEYFELQLRELANQVRELV